MAITVYFVRHGQTYLNRYNRMQGWSDAPLTEKGIEDAKRVGRELSKIKFDYIFSSDLSRAVNTARLLLAADPNTSLEEPIQEPAFREIFFGFFEGANGGFVADSVGGKYGYHTFSQMAAGWGTDELKNRIAAADQYGDAEDAERFWKRIDKGFDRLRNLPDGSVAVVVCHGAAIRSIADRYLEGIDQSVSPQNGSIMKMTLTDTDTNVDFYNQLHIPDE